MNGERLIIKNFGPINEVEISLRKFNFVIGNQASGKSVILKTLAILRDIKLFFLPLDQHIKKRFSDFNLNEFFKKNTYIEYRNEAFEVKIVGNKPSLNVIDNSDEAQKALGFISKMKGIIPEEAFPYVEEYLTKEAIVSIYIPAERIIIPNITFEPFKFSGEEIKLPEYLRSFGNYFTEARKSIPELKVKWLNLNYSYVRGVDTVMYKGKKLRLAEGATGFQALIPMLAVIEGQNKSEGMSATLTSYLIEEPEISLYPSTQYNLIKHIAEKCKQNDSSVFISTHSPYILSTVNNLLYAYKVGSKNPQRTSKVIEKKYWINPSDITAILLNETGKSEDLMDYEVNQLMAEKIDEISSQINIEFDKILNIEFSKSGKKNK